jgi:hypothetical protein
LQVPPQPSLAPQTLPAQSGAQRQAPLMHFSPGRQEPVLQIPPQPSGAPQALPVQSGSQTQEPFQQV